MLCRNVLAVSFVAMCGVPCHFIDTTFISEYYHFIVCKSKNLLLHYYFSKRQSHAATLRQFLVIFLAKTFGHQLNTEVYSTKFPFNECCISSLLFRSFTSRTKGCKCERAFGPCQRWM